jgi:hypothetical protein
MEKRDISNHPAFDALRYRDEGMPPIKAGILPYYRDDAGQVRFLLQRPKTTKPEDQDKTLPFQIARGSRHVWNGEEIRTREDAKRLGVTKEKHLQPADAEATKEGEEELGITKAGILILNDCGSLVYNGYGVHLFAAEMDTSVPLLSPDDSHEVRWMTLAQAREQTQTGDFKEKYLPMLEAAAHAINTEHRIGSTGQRRNSAAYLC